MKSNLPEIMNKKGITIRELQEKASYVVKGEDGGKTVNISTATILAARDNKKIESCRVYILKHIAHALGCKIKDLFAED